MLRAIVISNGIGAADAYKTTDDISYEVVEIGPGFDPDLRGYDLLLVPNGSDHVAMLRIRDKVRAFLDDGGALFCFCGWFTDWIPGNRWIHDASKATKGRAAFRRRGQTWVVRGRECRPAGPQPARHQRLVGVRLHRTRAGADVVLTDTWGRALIVLDGANDAGPSSLSPRADRWVTSAATATRNGLSLIYRNTLRFLKARQESLTLQAN